MPAEQRILSRIRVVLVAPRHPGNIGSAARAMKTMGLSQLVVVGYEGDPAEQSEARALSSGALDLLRRARRCATLAEAIADTGLQYALSARLREVAHAPRTPREAAAESVAALAQAAAGADVALVFGNETFGLANEDVMACNRLVHIPANPEYSSLNLAASVQVLCYEMRQAALLGAGAPALPVAPRELARQEDVERFFTALESSLVRSRFLHPDNPRRLMEKLRRLFMRGGLEKEEVHILRGMLQSWDEAGSNVASGPDRDRSRES